MASAAVEKVITRVSGVHKAGVQWLGKCPAHPDAVASLAIREGAHGKAILFCHAGCSLESILGAMGLSYADLFSDGLSSVKNEPLATYAYQNVDGALLFEVCRFFPKDFRQRRPDPAGGGAYLWNLTGVPRVPYRLPELLSAAMHGETRACIVEGEKDADRLWLLDIPATTNAGGAGKWRAEETAALKEVGIDRVIIIPDNDEPGQKHADVVAMRCAQAGLAVTKLGPLPGSGKGGDVSDWLGAGHSKADLEGLFTKPYVVPPGVTVVVPPPPAVVIVLPDTLTDPLGYRITGTIGAGAAESFRDRFKDRLRYDHTRDQWFVWDRHRWRRDTDEEVVRLALEHSRRWGQEVIGACTDWQERKKWQDYTLKLERHADRKTMLLDARTLPPFKGTPVWDANPWLLGVPNGVLDLKTGTLRDGQPTDGITLQTGVPYDPEAQCPRWLQFLQEVFDDPMVVEFVQQFCGYRLTGRTSEQIVVFCYGMGRNGKGRLWSAMRGVLGEYAAVLPFSSLIATRKGGEASNDLAAIQGKRLVTASEINEGARLNEARIKGLTGEDPITARFLYAEYGTFDPAAKFVLAVNHKPVVRDDSDGFWRRVRLVPFNKQFVGTDCDPLLDEKLKKEWPGILTWAVAGCLTWAAAGALPQPYAIMQATHEYEQESDPLGNFVAESCDTDDPAEVTGATALFKAYLTWCDESAVSREDRLTSTAFGLAMTTRFKKQRSPTGHIAYSGVRLRSGLKL